MATWWQPTSEGYFRHIPKTAILQTVGEYAPEHVTRLAKLKKADIASEAERLADGTGCMPAMFKAEGAEVTPTQDDLQAVTDDQADTVNADEAQPHALVA